MNKQQKILKNFFDKINMNLPSSLIKINKTIINLLCKEKIRFFMYCSF